MVAAVAEVHDGDVAGTGVNGGGVRAEAGQPT
jgi:hypothetical protein